MLYRNFLLIFYRSLDQNHSSRRSVILVAACRDWGIAYIGISYGRERGPDDETYARFSGVGSIQVLVSYTYVCTSTCIIRIHTLTPFN